MTKCEKTQKLRSSNIFFSVLIPSRNRADQLDIAIMSILNQTYDNYEIIVLNDGSNGIQHKHYLFLEQKYVNRVKFIHLDCVSAPHGKSRGLNTGISLATGDYICFLDDDDYWIYADHLKIVNEAIICSGYHTDVFLSNQEQADPIGQIPRDNWLACLNDIVACSANKVLPNIYNVSYSLLMQQKEFCHMNTIIAKKSLITDINGLDNYLWYEEDHDFYLRLIDKAKYILFSKTYTSHCNVPDSTSTENLSTRATRIEKLLIKYAIFNKRYVLSERSDVRSYSLRGKIQTIKSIAIEMHKAQKIREAVHFASETLCIGFSIKWFGYLTWLLLIALKNKAVNLSSNKSE